MNKAVLFALSCLAIFSSCSGQQQPASSDDHNDKSKNKVFKNYDLSDAVRCGFLDQEGIMWFGTNNEGVYRYDGTSFANYSKKDGLCSNYVSSIVEDNNGDLWFGTDKGLCHYDKKTFTHVPIPWDGNEDLWGEGMNANLVLSLLKDKKGNIWLGTWGNGAHRFNPSQRTTSGNYTFTSFLQQEGATYDDGLHRNVIQSIIEDRSGNIWLTSMTHGGVSRFDGTAFTHFMPADGLSDDMVFSALEDRAGNLWFGMLGNRDGGLDRYDGNSFTRFNTPDGLCNSNVIGIFEDRNGKLWLGSGRGKLCICNPKEGSPSFTTFTTQDGQTFEKIRFITEDATGNIWFGGNYGRLFRYDGRTVMDFTQK
ncbi:MAG: two-component regulator propeller domain-containing protein [Saprospiraceae bacterium]